MVQAPFIVRLFHKNLITGIPQSYCSFISIQLQQSESKRPFGCPEHKSYLQYTTVQQDFASGSVLKLLPAMQEMQVGYLGREDPLWKEMATHSSILARKTHGQRSLAGYSSKSPIRVRHNLATKTTTVTNSQLSVQSHQA